jgi:hypothetical protein
MVLPKIIVGNFVKPDGSPAAGATLTLLLSQDATIPGRGQIGHYAVVVVLDANGSIPSSAASPGPETDTKLYANDQILPVGTHYFVTVKDDTFGVIYAERLTIQGDSPIDLSTLAPVQR